MLMAVPEMRCSARPFAESSSGVAFAGCGFSYYTINALVRNDLGTPAKLLAFPTRDIKYLHRIGNKGRAEIEAWLA